MTFNLEESAMGTFKRNQVTGSRRHDVGMITSNKINDENKVEVSFKRRLAVQLT